MKKNFFTLITFSFLTTVIFAQNLSLPLSCVKIGWGWNVAFSYDVANPNQYAGEGCNATTVSKVDISGWVGSFGLTDLPSPIDWTKYDKIELLVYSNANGVVFDDTVSYKGWYDNDTTDAIPGVDNVVNCNAVQTEGIPASNWVTRVISLTEPLINSANNTITYSSLSDSTFGLYDIQFPKILLPQETASLYIGAITLIDKNLTSIENEKFENLKISINSISNKISVNSTDKIKSISVINSLGKEMISNQNENSISTESLPFGIYIIKVNSSNNSTYTQTFIKK